MAFLASGWTFWDIVQGKRQGRFTPRQPSYFQDLIWRDVEDGGSIKPPDFYDEGSYRQTWTARIDGSVPPVPVDPATQAAAAPVKKIIEPIDTVLEVDLICWNDDPLLRFAAIAYKSDQGRGASTGGKSRRLHLTEGEPLRPPYDGADYNGKVLEIGKQTVTFAWGEGEVTVNPQLGGADGTNVPADDFTIAAEDDPARDFDSAPEDSVQLDDGSWVLGIKDQQRITQETRAMLDEDLLARTVTPTGGGRSYLELTNVRAGSLPSKYGFQTGDRIISVNGIPMPSLSAAVNWGKANPNLPQYHVVFERKGKVLAQTIHWKG